MTSIEKVAHLANGSGFDMEKVESLGAATRYDVCASTSSKREVKGATGIGSVLRGGLCHSFTPDGRCVSLFKTLYTNSCSHECNYCTNSSKCTNKSKAYSYSPEELAKTTLALYKGNYIEGLFLSSGIGGDENKTMDDMIESVRLLRNKYLFRGYVHMKILPGASQENIKQAMELSDRVSINIEASKESYLQELCPTKDFQNDIILRQRMIRDLSRKNPLGAGQTTQMVVGAAEETDKEILDRSVYEYSDMLLKRVYYSVFTPIKGTGFEDREMQPRWREHRLYQMDWLHRIYKLDRKEIDVAFNEEGFLENCDPKMAIARQTLDGPVDPNTADYKELIRVPGIGPTSAERIIQARKKQKITKKRELTTLGVRVDRAKPFMKIGGWLDETLMRWQT
jgi:putative DNA modification/repair radical SAM protein